jgi:hypothetical protein
MIKYFLLIWFTTFYIFSCSAQNSSNNLKIDRQNFEAKIKEQSNKNEPIYFGPDLYLTNLPEKVLETSGLIKFKGGLFTHNDSGDEAAIYKLDIKTGKILQNILINNTLNIDFEDIAQDDKFIYVGDFGNNLGIRKDLCIYKIAKDEITDDEMIRVNAKQITFSYNDQTGFDYKNRSNNFDCEAMISKGDFLFIFSKNWENHQTKSYRIPKKPGNYNLEIYNKFEARGLITGADYNEENETLVLIGYEYFVPFVWIMQDFENNDFFNGNKKRIDFAPIQGAQTEGVCFLNRDEIIISCEKSFYLASIFKCSLQELTHEKIISDTSLTPLIINNSVSLNGDRLKINLTDLSGPDFKLELYNLYWDRVKWQTFREQNYQNGIDVFFPMDNIDQGIYFLRIIQEKRTGFAQIKLER